VKRKQNIVMENVKRIKQNYGKQWGP